MSKKKDSLKPWLSRPAINRSVTLPLTRPLTQRLSNLNEFHPNELDPYLLFDARDSMIGTLENPTLDLDPSKPDTLNVITATRAGTTATYTDSSGLIQVASADTVRVDHVDGVPMILVEPSATNLLDYSEDFSNAAWTKNNLSVESGQTSPSGDTSAFRLNEDTSAGYHNLYTLGPTSDEYHTATIYAKAGERTKIVVSLGADSNRVIYDLLAGTFVNSGLGEGKMEAVSNGWYKCSTSTKYPTPTPVYHLVSLVEDSGARIYTGDGTSGVYIWGAQLEAGSVATSLIPTSGGDAAARTRAADDLVISGSAFSDFFNASEGTFYVEVVDRQATETAHSYIVGQSTSQFFIYKNDGDVFVSSYDGPLGVLNVGSVVANQLFRAAVSYKTGVSPAPSVKSLSFNGTSEVDQPYSGNFAATNILKIGSGYTNVFSGHFRRIIYWPYHSDSL